MSYAKILMMCLLVSVSAMAQDDESQNDSPSDASEASAAMPSSEAGIVVAILDRNGITGVQLDNIATFSEGRITTLNLNNPEPGKKGISTLGPEIARLTELKELSLNDNDIVSLPDEIGQLTKLRKLEVKSNSLVTIPSTIGNLSSLEELDVRNNELTSLPIEIGLCGKLWKLQLWGNALRSLPETIGSLSALRELYLRGNRLQGFPSSIRKLNLSYVDIQENRLCEVSGDIDLWLKKFEPKYRSWQKCW